MVWSEASSCTDTVTGYVTTQLHNDHHTGQCGGISVKDHGHENLRLALAMAQRLLQGTRVEWSLGIGQQCADLIFVLSCLCLSAMFPYAFSGFPSIAD